MRDERQRVRNTARPILGIATALGILVAAQAAKAQANDTTAAPQSAAGTEAASDDAHADHKHGFHDDDAPEVEPRQRAYSFGLDELVVTASPLPRKATQLPGAVSILKGEELLQKQQPTIGETVRYIPGVSASYFGPGASRPILRGLGGPRVGMLIDHVEVFDASASSNDHAVAVDTLGVERIEVLRGPATLRYGPNTVGGVVNTIENRVPRSLVEDGFDGSVELRGSSVDGGFGGAAVLTGNIEKLVWRVKGYGFSAGDTSIPGFAESQQLRDQEQAEGDADEDPEEEAFGTIPNSDVQYAGFSAGASWVDDDFYMGVALSDFRSNYGVVFHEIEGLEGHSHGEVAPGAEPPPIVIELDSWSLDFAGGVQDVIEGIHSIDARLRLTDYQHQELEGTFIATNFESRAYDLRIEAVHERFGIFEGAFGFQSNFNDFKVSGEEGFLPNTFSARQSFFVIEEVDLAPVTLELGGRFDYATVESGGGGRFGPEDKRTFPLGSASLGVVYNFIEDQILSLDTSWSMRPPNFEELYANGVHIASGFFEIGDRELDTESAFGVNLGYSGRFSIVDWSVNAFYNRFWDYIYLQGQDRTRNNVEIGRWLAADAEFAGGELQAAVQALEEGPHRLQIIARADGVYAQDLSIDQPLPRMPPVRFGGSLVYGYDSFQAQFDALRATKQDRVPDGEFTTAGYTMLDLSFNYIWKSEIPVTPIFFFRISNLLNEEARASESFLRDRAPLPGRNFTGGIQVQF